MIHYMYPGISVDLRVNGVPLTEYDVEEVDEEEVNTVVKYVEAAPGTNFAVHFKALADSVRAPKDEVNMGVYLDGKCVTGVIYDISNHGKVPNGRTEQTLEGVQSNTPLGMVLERFTFAQLKTDDSPVNIGKDTPEAFKQLGEVSVKCTWARPAGPVRYKQQQVGYESIFSRGVSEKSLKGRAISSHAALGAPEHRPGSIEFQPIEYPYGRSPFAIFCFRYRTHRDLQIEGVIPRSPSPAALEDRDPDDLSRDEMRELLRRMREREASATRIKREKRERSTDVNDSDGEIEVTGDRSKRRRTSDDSGIEIVDLTDD